jgi:DNA polymerase-3 subunit gamma/tau
MSRLSHIAKNEGIDLTDDGARVIARVSRGGMRDAVSLLELCAGARKTVDANLVFETVGTGNRDSADKLIEAILKQNYTAVYATVNEVVMNSADVSVFWQEIIDSYRDIMVVKNTDRAKDYLDLTEVEYDALVKLAQEFTPSRLAYHVSILEGAMADMQRAFNSKRSIAEIALTRMCDAKSAVTAEALALRVDELERELSIIKLGAGSINRIVNDDTNVKVLPAVKVIEENNDNEKEDNNKNEKKTTAEKNDKNISQTVKYSKWSSVVERIGELKCSLSVQFMKSSAFVKPDGTYLIRMNSFFAKKLSGSDSDLSILRGIIAEKENLPADEVRIVIEPQDMSSLGDYSDEIESNLGNGEVLF